MPTLQTHDSAREVLLTAARSQSSAAELKCHALFGLIDTCQTLEHDLRHELARSELTEQGFQLLAHLVRNQPAAMTPGEAADRLSLPRPAISHILGRLEISGLITRERNAQDRRSLAVNITDKGRHVFASALTTCLQSINRLMSAVDPQEIHQLDHTCARLRQNSLAQSVR